MQIFVDLIKQLPPIWPRVAALIGLALLFVLPEARRFLLNIGLGDRRSEQLNKLLQLRKLELEVAALKAANPEAGDSPVDAQIEKTRRLLIDEEDERDYLSWSERAQLALAGAFGGMLISSMALWIMGRFSVVEPSHVLLKEFVVALAGGLLASAIPSRTRWYCVFHGILVPALVAALSVAAGGQD
jgi:hypothetical protein